MKNSVKTAALLYSVLVSGACANLSAARESSKLMAVYTTKLQHISEEFSNHRDALAKARTANVNRLEASALRAEQGNSIELYLWSLETDDSKRTLLDGVLKSADHVRALEEKTQMLRDDHAKRVKEAAGAVRVRSDALSDTAAALAQLGEEPDIGKRISFYRGFFEDVRKAVDAAEKESAQRLERATESVKGKEPPDEPTDDSSGDDDGGGH